jgi:acetyl-CoA synthetase
MPRQPAEATTEITDAEDVLMLIYTSGTTGKPKGAVHTHCGFPIKAAQDMRHSMDLKPEDTIFWFTDMGWMMGPWLVFGALLNGATMVFYDGAPDYPDVDRVWALVERHRITHLGVSPTLIRSLKPHGAEPVQRHDLSSLRAVGLHRQPVGPGKLAVDLPHRVARREADPQLLRRHRDQRRHPLRQLLPPLKPCAFQRAGRGHGRRRGGRGRQPVRGAVGELVIRQPWIGMTRGFWQDRERYLETYWRRCPACGCMATSPPSTPTGCGTSWGAATTRSRWRQAAWPGGGRGDPQQPPGGQGIRRNRRAAPSQGSGGRRLRACCASEVEPSEALRTALIELVTAELGKPLKPRTVRFVRRCPRRATPKSCTA